MLITAQKLLKKLICFQLNYIILFSTFYPLFINEVKFYMKTVHNKYKNKMSLTN